MEDPKRKAARKNLGRKTNETRRIDLFGKS
jgi:hypothetical protein